MEFEDEASKIAAEIDKWQSPRLGKVSGLRIRHSYEGTSNDWLRDDPMATSPQDTSPANPTERLLRRMDTPDTSRHAEMRRNENTPIDEDEETPPPNVRSPWTASTTPATLMSPIVRRSNPSFKSSHNDYHRYYDATLQYLKSRRRFSDRVALQNQKARFEQTAMITDENEAMVSYGDEKLSRDETAMELDYLRMLSTAGWDRASKSPEDASRKEGNFWLLLHHLRQLGLSSLIWNDDGSSQQLYNQSIELYVQSRSNLVTSSDKEIIDKLYLKESGCPIVLKRRRSILKWFEDCYEELVPNDATRPRKSNYIENSKLLQEGLPETDKDAEIMRSALALVIAGRLEDAQQLARESGVPWRAAVWGGGEPDDGSSAGNPRRFLWKRMMWLQSDKLTARNDTSKRDEAAIASLLCSNVKNTLENESCRSWEFGLYAMIRGMLDRTEDEVLHSVYAQRRKLIPYFPVAEKENVSSEYLKGTAELAGLNEKGAVDILKTTPFEEMKCNGTIAQATSSFIIGKTSVTNFMLTAGFSIDNESSLRFLAHLALYLDSIATATNHNLGEQAKEWRNQFVSGYVAFLASREDLWYMIVLYASLLPKHFVFEQLPEYLAAIESPPEREVIVRQLRELLPYDDWDTEVLVRTFDIVLNEEDVDDSTESITLSDSRKMRAALWLTFDSKHSCEALTAANKLLRCFLLAGKTQSANSFIPTVPLEVLHCVTEKIEVSDSDRVTAVEQQVGRSHLVQTLTEFRAFQAYVEALTAYEQWKYMITSSETAIKMVDVSTDRESLHQQEATIADSNVIHQYLSCKRQSFDTVISVANDARTAFESVLKYPGGFLVTEDELVLGNDDDETRHKELEMLRAEFLPRMIKLYLDVCSRTAEWTADAIDDVALKLNCERESAIESLDESTPGITSAISPQYWAKQAVEVVTSIASDEQNLYSVIGALDLEEFIRAASDCLVIEMQF